MIDCGRARGAVSPENLAHLKHLPTGWADLYAEMLRALPAGFSIDWAVEKLGGLRCSPIGDHAAIFDRYEEHSRRICAACGAPGRMMHHAGFYLPHCPDCSSREGFSDPSGGRDS